MPKNKVNNLITDQEMTFARLVLSGTMTDRDAAQAAGLKPDSAAYIKAKPSVRTYMIEHRAAVEQKLVELEAEEIRMRNIRREQVLRRLWELANISPEITHGSMTGQVKAMAMIVAIEGHIPERRARSAKHQPAPPAAYVQPYTPDGVPEQQGTTRDPEPNPPVPEPVPGPIPAVDPNEPTWANSIHPPENMPLEAHPTELGRHESPLPHNKEPL